MRRMRVCGRGCSLRPRHVTFQEMNSASNLASLHFSAVFTNKVAELEFLLHLGPVARNQRLRRVQYLEQGQPRRHRCAIRARVISPVRQQQQVWLQLDDRSCSQLALHVSQDTIGPTVRCTPLPQGGVSMVKTRKVCPKSHETWTPQAGKRPAITSAPELVDTIWL